MSRKGFVSLELAALALAIAAAGCGGAAAVTGSEPPPEPVVVGGNAAVQGSVQGASDLKVGVVGMSLSASVDEEGQFALTGLPAGSVTLRFTGSGVDAKVAVDGLQNGLVTSVDVSVSGAEAKLTTPPRCEPTADTFFTGVLESISETSLVVAGRKVDVTQLKKVWRGNRRIQFSELAVGEKVKVWGTLRADGVVLAEEISALSNGDDTWVDFTGPIESIKASMRETTGTGTCIYSCVRPTLVVKGTLVYTSESTAFQRASDGSKFDPSELRVGQTVQVTGWKKPDGAVRAAGIRL